MSEKIKTRTVQRNIKSLNRTVTTVDHVRGNRTEKGQKENENPVNDAEDKVISGGYTVTRGGIQQTKNGANYVKSRIKMKPTASKDTAGDARLVAERKELLGKEQERKANGGQRRWGASQMEGRSDYAEIVKRKKEDPRSVPKSKKNITGSIKRNRRSIKTAGYTRKTVVKTSETTVKASKQAAQKAIKDAKKSTQIAGKTQQEARRMTKIAVRSVKNAVQGAVIASKTAIALIVSGGWIAVAIILLILMAGLVANSAFGIFFSGDDKTGSEQSMPEVIAEIDQEYQTKIDTIKRKNVHDVLEVSGARATWKEVLSVYSVKTNTDATNPQEVVTIDDEKKQLLRTIFWEMNVITHHTEKRKEKMKQESDDGKGNIKQKEKEVTRTYLFIQISHKSAEEMSKEYRFRKNQNEQLMELLAEKNDSLWTAVLHGTSNSIGNGDIVGVAKSQIGNVGGEPYWRWYGFNSRVSWCACFVSWCANQCGYIESGVIPRFSLCTDGVAWFQRHEQWYSRDYTTAPGDIIFFDWDGDGNADHVGIVEKSKGGTVYTIEGNTSDSCKQHTYSVGSGKILGYGVPKY